MPRLHQYRDYRDEPARPLLPDGPRTRYVIERHEDLWLIKFDGQTYGPYQTEREATLFAVDAAHKLGEQGEDTQVLRLDEDGDARVVWTYGEDKYPPRG